MQWASRPRPALFRALGKAEPPTIVSIEGQEYKLAHIYKHDSWAATGRYEACSGVIVCKFNRIQSIFGLPMSWLGRWLARRESAILERLDDVPGIPRHIGPVVENGRCCEHAVAHDFVAGEPLGTPILPTLREKKRITGLYRHLPDHFFPALRLLLATMHLRGLAYVDLHKRENILVGDDGWPYLIDFQVCFGIWPQRWARLTWVRNILAALQGADLYHLAKHISQFRPDQVRLLKELNNGQRPWWINIHRMIAVPLRKLRRSLLSWLGIRQKGGRGETEVFPEEALRYQRRSAA